MGIYYYILPKGDAEVFEKFYGQIEGFPEVQGLIGSHEG